MNAIFFDFDGVVADSRDVIQRCFDAALLERGLLPLDQEMLSEVIGPPLAEAFELVLARRGTDLRSVGHCVRTFRQRYARVSLEATVLQPGMLDALRVLAEHAPLALATSKPLSLTEPLLRQLAIRELFSAVAAPTEERDGEPKTATLRHAVTRLGEALGRSIDPAQAAIVGDRRHDVAAGKALRMTTIGVAWGCGSLTELRVAGADSIVSNPGELVATLLTAASIPPCRVSDPI